MDHPNRPFVDSVLRGLREGFWLFADEQPDDYPLTWDETRAPFQDDQVRQFLRDQRDEEIAAGRWSPSFGPDLLPGMYSMPIFAIPKREGSDKLRLINDLSAGRYSVNSMVRPEAVKGVTLDGIPALGDSIRSLADQHPGEKLMLWKSDIAHAYRNLPVHPTQQRFHINTIDGLRYVDHNLPFGARGSLKIWLAFDSLVHWIAVHKYEIRILFNYVDDSFGPTLGSDLLWFGPYHNNIPFPQARFLSL